MSSWQENSVMILRELVGDSSESSEFSDSRFEEIIFSAMFITNYEGLFNYSIDVATQTISSEPTNDFLTLSIFKSLAIITCGEYRQSSKSAMVVKDGPSSIDTKGIAENKKNLCNQFSKQYSDALTAKRAGDSAAYYAIIGPFNYDGASYGSSRGDPRGY
jgi:hypothetical protein